MKTKDYLKTHEDVEFKEIYNNSKWIKTTCFLSPWRNVIIDERCKGYTLYWCWDFKNNKFLFRVKKKVCKTCGREL